jgi:2-polyprenyl-6-methoxyphenol hydroxylase-like FAD-dependent oxidoreductase
MTTALVSGASVAGLATAYWLEQHGYSVTVVERYDGLRPGGQAIDVRGPALGILDRMGLRQAAENMKTNIRGASFVDRDGNELSRDTEATPTGGVIDNPDIEILRDDLVALLPGSLSDDVDFIFSDSITGLDDRGDVIAVSFERADAREGAARRLHPGRRTRERRPRPPTWVRRLRRHVSPVCRTHPATGRPRRGDERRPDRAR